MKLSVAYHCHGCQEIFERAPHGVCPRCASQEISCLSWLVKSTEERTAWFERIQGATRRIPTLPAKAAFHHSCSTTVNTLEPKAA